MLNPDLEKSLSSLDTSLIDGENAQEEGEPCKRDCTMILKRLAKIFYDVRYCYNSHNIHESYPPMQANSSLVLPLPRSQEHKNKKRWNEDHTTKAGCPYIRRLLPT